jgi:phosphate-selective porin OprO and OprP
LLAVKRYIWNTVKALVGSAGLALAICPGVARAEDPTVEELKARLDRLEKQNEYLQKVIEAGGIQAAGTSAAIGQNKAEVEKIIADYMKTRETAAKAAEAKAKLEADAKGYEVGSDLKFNARWNYGLIVETANKDFRLHLGGRFQEDWVFFNADSRLQAPPGAGGVGPLDDGVIQRRVRLKFDGQVYEVIEYDCEVDLESLAPVTWDDMWVGMTQIPFLGTVRVGHIKVPQGLETYTSSRNLTFLERAGYFDAFVQEYDPGVWILNNAFDQRVTWAAAIHRIDPTATGSDFGDGEYAITGRATCLPIFEHEGRCLLHLGASAQFRNSESTNVQTAAGGPAVFRDVVRFRARPDLRDGNGSTLSPAGNNNRWVDTGNIICDNVQTYAAEGLLIWGPFSIQTEYFYVNVNDAFTPALGVPVNRGNVNFQAFYVYGSYFLTGENRYYDKRLGRLDRQRTYENAWIVSTADDDDCCAKHCCCGKGAWELAVRYDWLDLTDSGINGGELSEYTFGLNWYLNANMKVQANYIRAHRDIPAPNVSGWANLFGVRVHYDW